MESVSLSVVIVTFNSAGLLERCLTSLLSSHEGVRVVVVDNASTDSTCEILRSRYPDVRQIANSTNLGFSRACNQGAQGIDDDYLLFLNPDVFVEQATIADSIAFMKSKPAVGVLGCRLKNPDGSYQKSAGRRRSILQEFRERRIRRRIQRGSADREFLTDEPTEAEWISGAFLLIRTRTFRELEGFDEALFAYFEDIDLCLRARERGWKVVYLPKAEAVHIGAASSGDRLAADLIYRQSQLAFYKKHHGTGLNLIGLRGYFLLKALIQLAGAGWNPHQTAQLRFARSLLRLAVS